LFVGVVILTVMSLKNIGSIRVRLMESVYKTCLWIARGWMVLVAAFLIVAIYLLFFENAALFASDSLAPDSPLSSRLFMIGFICFLFLLGYAQHYLIQRKLSTFDD